MRKIVSGIVVALGLLTPGIAAAPAAADADRARILIIGDSVTHGGVGQYTWRYRLWYLLAGQNIDFVGPASGVMNADGADDPSGYADPNFDRDHAAWSGETMMFPHWSFAELISDYRPDVVINNLGINDLCFVTTPDGAVAEMQAFIQTVRSIRPHATIVLGQMTQSWLCGAPDYNAKLAAMAQRWDRLGARVVVAIAPADYVEGVDTWDTRHPSASGEVKIAQQFASALIGLIPPTHIPDSWTGTARIRVVRAHRHSVRLAIRAPAQASGELIWRRNLSRHGHWRQAAGTHGLKRHTRYALKVQSQAYGVLDSPTFSNTVRVRTR